ncbi:Uncharacterised protein [Legionella beliardensis]|uniref:Transmembrane protein n=1 Tax=Legionella beliardensis TaxID=91822 RepID=A0A378I2M7_9GAMM|nr:hypothetical protein [Legionella beliardensis]STX29429.1 Uncharacterised protein [Legionella beliardensis]
MDNNKNNNKPLSPQWTAAIFFAVFGFFFLLLTKYMLLSLQQSAALPFFPASLVALITGGFLGYLFGQQLIKERAWGYVFLLGLVIGVVAIILISIAVFIHAYFYDPTIINHLQHWRDYFIIYGIIFLSLLLTVGLWLILFMGLAAVYFNKRFWPTLVAIEKKSLNKP